MDMFIQIIKKGNPLLFLSEHSQNKQNLVPCRQSLLKVGVDERI